MSTSPLELVSVVAAVLILVAYFTQQLGWLSSFGLTYSALNLIGSLWLALIAASNMQYGFLLLEGTWALISCYGMLRAVTRASPHDALLK
jgi:hypothetical protein